MIDIHAHLLPGVDDGARDLNEALVMARLAVADGITHLFATPHQEAYGHLPRPELLERVAQLQQELDTANIALTVLPGYEIRLHGRVFEEWEQNLAGPLADTRYVLAEPLFNHYDHHTDRLLFEFFEQGYLPVMAHPERIIPVQHNIKLIEPFLKRGGLTQITSHSLTGYHGPRAKQVAETLIREGMAHILASDAHDAQRRTPSLSAALKIVADLAGPAQAQAMVTTTPLAIVNNQFIATSMLVI
jgi:protein-tyrosine phosphatase